MTKTIKIELYSQVSRLTRALSSPGRLEIIDLLSQGEKTVEVISEESGLSVKNTSAQLKELKAALLVQSRKEGRFVYYSLSSLAVSDLWLDIRRFCEAHFLELKKIAESVVQAGGEIEMLNRKELLANARQGKVVLLDVRPNDEFESSHIPYALSLPMQDLKKRLQEIPKDKEIVAYCRGPYCIWAKEAADFLRSAGFKATHISDGVREWASAGLPLKARKAN